MPGVQDGMTANRGLPMPVSMRAILAAALALGAGAGHAKMMEETIELPVEVTSAYGRVFNHSFKVTIFRDDARARSPFLVLNHGRSAYPSENVKLGRARFTENSRYFVSKGFAVFVPTRVGYGVTGGADVEDSGDCRGKRYPPVYEAAAVQSAKVIDYAKTLPYIDPARGLVIGQSFGGTVAITVAAKNIPGVLAAVNFAGGGGGNPDTQPERPCGPELLAALFASYGATAKIPTLWLYSENDKYFGRENPKNWFQGFVKNGGTAQFVQLPPYKTNGHGSFTSQPASWKPAFEEFLRANGLADR
jgi:dienelactone hydrolase